MKLDHMVILVSDLEQCMPFYRALLPLIEFKEARPNVFVNQQEIYLDFRQAPQPKTGYERHAPGLNHMGFSATDRATLLRVQAAMAEAGFEVPEVQEFDDGTAIFFKDNDGMRIELSWERT